MKIKKKLKDIRWGTFKIKDIFEVNKGVYLNENKIIKGDTLYITAKSDNNGLNSFIGNSFLYNGNSITIEKIKLTAYYQPDKFYCSHDVTVISNSFLNKYNALFICSMINRQGNKYSYGRQAQMNVVKSETIQLPINVKNLPDYTFMEKYIQQQEQAKKDQYHNYITKRLKELKNYKVVKPLVKKEWREFNLIDIFPDIQRGKRLKKGNHTKGITPYISSSALNNGVDGFVGNKDKVRIFSDCLTLANSGSVGATFYHPYSFVASDHITKLNNEQFSKYVYLFISITTKRLSEKYSFNREINDKRIQREMVILPINAKGKPDYEYMENYIKKLEFDKLSKYKDLKLRP